MSSLVKGEVLCEIDANPTDEGEAYLFGQGGSGGLFSPIGEAPSSTGGDTDNFSKDDVILL